MVNISEDQNLNSALSLVWEANTAAFRFEKWLFKMGYKHRHLFIKKKSVAEEACSMYRGGYFEGEEEELKQLFKDLAGTEDSRLDGNFFFLGRESDLSYFWKREKSHIGAKNVSMKKSYIESIADEELRSSVLANFSVAEFRGYLVQKNGEYVLTEEGKKRIYCSDFIFNRVKHECQYFGIAVKKLDRLTTEAKKGLIDQKLVELGLEGKFDNCDRATLNIDTLLAKAHEESLEFFVPRTGRKMTIEISKENLLKLDERTYAAFFDKNAEFTVKLGDEKKMMSEKELFSYFDNKNERMQGGKQTVEAAGKTVKKTAATAEQAMSETTRIGKEYEVFLPDGKFHKLTATSEWNDENGLRHINFKDKTGELGDILLPADADGKLVFTDKAVGERFIAENKAICEKYHTLLEKQLPQEYFNRTYEVRIESGRWVETDECYTVASSKTTEYERLRIQKENAREQADGTLIATLNEKTEYTVSTGEYTYPVDGKTAHEMFTAATPTQSTTAVSQGSTTAAQGAGEASKVIGEKVEKSAEVAATASQKAVETVTDVVSKVPPTGVVSTAVNTVTKTVGIAAKGARAAHTTLTLVNKLN